MAEISDERLELCDIPSRDASWNEIVRFGYTFDAYRHCATIERCAELARERRHETLADLRTCLFFELRRWNELGRQPDEDAMSYIRQLLDLIRKKVEDRANAR